MGTGLGPAPLFAPGMKTSIVKRESPAIRKLTQAAELGKRGDYKQAVKILRDAISETDAPPEASLLLGRSLHALKDYSRALAAFSDYIKLKPDAGEGYLFTGRTYLTLGMAYKAVPFLRKALENSTIDPSASLKTIADTKALLGTAYLRSKHSQAAVQILEEAVNDAPADKRIYRAYLNSLLVRGIRLCKIDDHETGLQMLRFVLENGAESGMADNTFLRLELGMAARETGRLEEALDHFSAALKLSKKDGGAAESSGAAGAASGLPGAEASRAANPARGVIPYGAGPHASERGAPGQDLDGDRRIRWARASILMALGKTAEAGKEIEKIRSRDAGVPELPWNSELVDLFLIRSFLNSGEWRRAAEVCKTWLKTREQGRSGGQNRPVIHALYAEALRNLRNYKAAHNHLLRALEEKPEELEFWYADILVSWEGEDYKSLRKALRAAKSLGGDEDILKRFDILCRTRTSNDTEVIVTLLQNAIRSLGPEPELMYSLGEAYLKLGLIEEAQSWFNKTISIKKDHESAWLGEIAALEALFSQEADREAGRETGLGASAEGRDRGQEIQKLDSLYKAYLEKWPDNSNIRRDRALFLVKTLEYAEAALELEKLLVWEPSNQSLRRVLAYTYRKTGRYREAAVFLKALLRERPADIDLLIEYSGCLERAGGEIYAIAVLEKARQLFLNPPKKQIAGEKIEAEESKISGISMALGILSFRQKNTEKAFDYLREAAAMAPLDPRPYEWMAAIAGKNGDRGGASYYQKMAEKRKKSRK